jgi:hypothetical protein
VFFNGFQLRLVAAVDTVTAEVSIGRVATPTASAQDLWVETAHVEEFFCIFLREAVFELRDIVIAPSHGCFAVTSISGVTASTSSAQMHGFAIYDLHGVAVLVSISGNGIDFERHADEADGIRAARLRRWWGDRLCSKTM